MVRMAYSQMGGHGLVQMTGVWVAVVKATVDKAKVTHFRRALEQVRRSHPRCGCGVERRIWSPHICRSRGRTTCTCGNTQVRRACLFHHPESKKRSSARCSRGRLHSPLTCGGEQESDAESGGVSGSWRCLRIGDTHCFCCLTHSITVFLSQMGGSPLCPAPPGMVPGAPGGPKPTSPCPVTCVK